MSKANEQAKRPKMAPVPMAVSDRKTGLPRWAVIANFTKGESGTPVCIEYRVRLLRGSTAEELDRNYVQTVNRMLANTDKDLEGEGDFPPIGIPRYVFEEASQGRLLDHIRDMFESGQALAPDETRALFAEPGRKPGRPPQRSLHEKLRILAEVESAQGEGRKLEDVASQVHMSRSALRDLLSWARHDASPQLFTAVGRGRGGGRLTEVARRRLEELDRGEA